MNDLDKLLELARHKQVTQEEREAQRLSFAYGNARLSNPRITRDSIKEAADQLAANPVTVDVPNK
ncbi:MAG: hypothetical protein E6J90_16785 [Deltaproteobacteria bacterium]|nr:MAG: hypothetical protein E6J91_30210 [Deltaproteobacteria bacterium]TMQ20095.1 MAG: hypothetical protein E6J90_16785 [Deltaproteobacteria bacterium]